jgi:hypothetical protein
VGAGKLIAAMFTPSELRKYLELRVSRSRGAEVDGIADLHGGIPDPAPPGPDGDLVCTRLDSVAAFALHSRLPQGRGCTSVQNAYVMSPSEWRHQANTRRSEPSGEFINP